MFDNSITDLSDEYNQSGRSIIVLGVLPDQENSMHDRNKEIVQLLKITRVVQLLKPVIKDIHKGVTVIGLDLGLLHLLFKLLKRLIVSTLALQQELQDLLHLL